MAFHLRQVEERAGAARDLFLGVVEEEHCEVENAAADALTVNGYMLLVEMPATRTNLQRGDLVVELVFLAGFVLERQFAADGLVHVDLALDLVVPVRGVGILEVGHVRIGARVEGVDDHLGFDRAGDFDAAAVQGRRHWRNLPVAFANGFGFGQEIGHFAAVDARLARDARFQQFLATAFEGAVQLGDEGQRIVGEDGFKTRLDRAGDLHALGQVQTHGSSFE